MPKDMSPPSAIVPQTQVFKTEDGAELVGQLFMPNHTPFAVVVLNGATGVAQGYYRHFARWLASERGIACLTYDYRHMGRSSQGSLRRSRATMSDWGIRDAEAAFRAVRKLLPDCAVWIMGHSLGGMLLPYQRHPGQASRIITVASGDVHVSDHPWPYRALPLLFWFVAGPLATSLVGYLPGRAIGFGADLPATAFHQWRRWCLTRGSVLADPRMPDRRADLPDAMRVIAISDDVMVPPHAVQRMADRFGTSAITIIDPRDTGLSNIGHLGPFHPRNSSVWPALIR